MVTDTLRGGKLSHPKDPAHEIVPPEQAAAPVRSSQDGDFVDELMHFVKSLAPAFAQTAEVVKVADEIRKRFGGNRVYIAHRRDISERDAAIKREYLAGERFAVLERRHGLSVRQIIRVIKS